jgi:hypothetical protein
MARFIQVQGRWYNADHIVGVSGTDQKCTLHLTPQARGSGVPQQVECEGDDARAVFLFLGARNVFRKKRGNGKGKK